MSLVAMRFVFTKESVNTATLVHAPACVCVSVCACVRVCATHGGLSDMSALEIRSRLGGGGPLGLRAQGPVCPGCGRLPVEPAGLPPRHPGASTLWLSEVTPSGSPLPFSGWRLRLSLRWFSWGSCVLGGPRMFGARIFSMPASCLAGWGCCSPHTLLNIYMEEPYEHKRDHTHRCTLKHSHWCKNRCSQTHIVLICCCFKTYFVILVRCAAQ